MALARQNAPRSCGFSADVIQSAVRPVAGATAAALELGMGEQFGQFRLVSGCQQDQPIQHAADRGAAGRQAVALAGTAGNLQGGIVDALEEGEAGTALSATPAWRSSATAPNLLSMHAGGLQFAARVPPIRAARPARPCGRIEFAAGAVDFELGHGLVARARPAQDILAAALGMPKDDVRI